MIINTRYICLQAMPYRNVNEGLAREIAQNFLQQHHSIIRVDKPSLQDNVWQVGIVVSSPQHKKFQVRINAQTGIIMNFHWSDEAWKGAS